MANSAFPKLLLEASIFLLLLGVICWKRLKADSLGWIWFCFFQGEYLIVFLVLCLGHRWCYKTVLRKIYAKPEMDKMLFILYNLLQNTTLPFNYCLGKLKYLQDFCFFDIVFKRFFITSKLLCLFTKFSDLWFSSSRHSERGYVSSAYAEKIWGYLYYKIKTLLKCQTEEIQGTLTFPSALLAICLFIPQCETFRICLGNLWVQRSSAEPRYSGAWHKSAFDLGTWMGSNMSLDLISALELGVLWV